MKLAFLHNLKKNLGKEALTLSFQLEVSVELRIFFLFPSRRFFWHVFVSLIAKLKTVTFSFVMPMLLGE